MKLVSLVTLNCDDGELRRYARFAGNKPVETGRGQFGEWKTLRDDPLVDWTRVWEWIASFRTAWTPPEEPGPRPTSPLRTARMARAA